MWIAIGDVDGAKDVATANIAGGDASVLLGGAKKFAATALPIGKETDSVAIGDLDGDGKADLVATRPAAGEIAVILGRPRFRWPAPAGWRTETIPFPLGFAPDIPLRGVEELRFAPSFFDPPAPGYFTYAFVWALDGKAELGGKAPADHLERYFAGLCSAVAKDEELCAKDRHRAELGAPKTRVQNGHEAKVLSGTIRTADPFKAKRELVLDVELAIWSCPISQRTYVLAKLAPKKTQLRKDLEAQAASFDCHPANKDN